MISTCMDENLLWRHKADQPASVAQSDGCLTDDQEGTGSIPNGSVNILFMEINHEIFSTVILGSYSIHILFGSTYRRTEGLARELIE